MRTRAVVTLLLLAACTDMPDTPESRPSRTRRQPERTVAVVHWTRGTTEVSQRVSRALAAGRITDWSELGHRAGSIRIAGTIAEVRADRDAIAFVPAEEIDATVRAIAVDGIDPIRIPSVRNPPVVTTVLIAGDVMMARRVGQAIGTTGDPARPFRLVAERMARADITVVNLESTLARLGAPTQGDAFAADPRSIEGPVLAGVDVASLANNHTGDFGPRSLVETVRVVRDAGIVPLGAGRTDRQAAEPAVVEREGIRIGFLAFNAIGETPTAGPRTPGAVTIRMQPRLGPLRAGDLAPFAAAVRDLRARVDAVVVLPHWGAQYTRAVHPDQRRVAARLARAGADAIVGTHSHWAGGLELAGDTPVAYSTGNFVFDMDLSSETMRGMALELVFWDGRLKAIEPLPVQNSPAFRPRFVAGADLLPEVYAAGRGPFGR